MRFVQLRFPNGFAVLRRRTLIIGLGVGVALAGYIIYKRYFRIQSDDEEYNDAVDSLPDGFYTKFRGGQTRRRTPVPSEKGLSHGSSLKSISNIPSNELELITSFQRTQELVQRIEKAVRAFDLIRNRSEKDSKRLELLSSVLDRLRVLETDLSRIVQEGGFEKAEIPFNDESLWMSGSNHRSGSLSVLSDDSFVSAFEELPLSVDDVDVLLREPLNLEKDALHLYHDGLKLADMGEICSRKNRTEFCSCDDETDFKAKLWCIRQAFSTILSDEHNRVWLSQAGRHLIADLLRHAGKDPSQFYLAYDSMMEYLNENQHMDIVEKELKIRGVSQLGFWDVVLDYVLIDAFEDLSKPPTAVLAVTRNMFLSQSMKESTLSTVIWSMLRAKRSRLTVPDGFVAHFYDISEAVSPSITLGFLGTDEHLRELCFYFKEQMCLFILDIFSVKKVRYTTLDDLADDVRSILETRLEMIQTRLSTELLPSPTF